MAFDKLNRLIRKVEKAKREVLVNVEDTQDSKTGTYTRTLLIRKFPPMVVAGFFDRIQQVGKKNGVHVRISTRFAPTKLKWNKALQRKTRRLERNIQQQESESDIARKEEKEALEALISLRDAQYENNANLYDVWTFLTLSAQDPEDLKTGTKKIQAYLKDLEAKVETFKKEQMQATRHSLLLHRMDEEKSKDFLNKYYGLLVHDQAASMLYMFYQGTIGDKKGVYIGNRAENGKFTLLDLVNPDDEDAKNILVMGTTGSGKSFFMKVLATGLMIWGVKLFVLDVDGEWRALCENVEGLYIDQSFDSGNYSDPFRLLPKMPETDEAFIKHNRGRLRTAIKAVHRIIDLLVENQTDQEWNAADRAILQVYEEAGVEREDPETWERSIGPRPTIHRFYEVLKKRGEEDPAAASLAEKLMRYFEGSEDQMFRNESDRLLNDDVPMVVYHVGEAINQKDDRVAAVKMNLSFDSIWANVQYIRMEGKTFSAVICDEGQRLLYNESASDHVYNLATTIRKFNGMIILATNTPEVLLEGGTKGGKGLWENTPIKVFFWMEESALNSIARNTEIPQEIIETVGKQYKTHVFALRYELDFDFLKVHVPPEEAELYKTRGLKKEKQEAYHKQWEEDQGQEVAHG